MFWLLALGKIHGGCRHRFRGSGNLVRILILMNSRLDDELNTLSNSFVSKALECVMGLEWCPNI